MKRFISKSFTFILFAFILFTIININSNLFSRQVKADDSFSIVQDYTNRSTKLKDFIYVNERMDWDVVLDNKGYGGLESEGFTWSSSDDSIVSIERSNDGIVYGILVAHKPGTAIITVTYSDGRTASATIKVKQPATSISLNMSATVYIGSPFTLKATLNPSNVDDKKDGIKWSSSNNNIASINTNTGLITGKKNGTVTITATFTNKDRFGNVVPEKVIAKSTITIKTHVSKMTLNRYNLTLNKGKKYTLKVSVSPSTASNKSYTLKSSNNKVASISSKGVITAKNYGEATITVTSKENNKKASIKITVPQQVKGSNISNNYVYSFSNNTSSYFKGNQKRYYYISNSDYKKLIKKLSLYYKNKFTNVDIKYINGIVNSKWGGSCFGMSLTVALNRSGQINVKKYTNSKGKGYQLNKVSYPKNSNKVKSTINYYYAITPYYIDKYRVYSNNKDVKKWTSNIKNLVTNAKNNKLQLFDFFKSNGSGHSILIKKYDKKIKMSGKYYYRLLTYDPNYPKKKTYVYIRTDYKIIKVQHYNWNITKFDVLSNFSEYKYVKID
ncbi:MAG: Ig-like domain-containing protein [Bacilli bacterium]|nr:Ig-like domain-containing protein [Bacilli bacterium]